MGSHAPRPCAAGHRLPSLSWFATRLWTQLAWLPLKVDSGAPRPRGDVIVDALLLQLARLEPCKSRHCATIMPTAASIFLAAKSFCAFLRWRQHRHSQVGDQDQAAACFIQAWSNLHRLRITSVWADGVVVVERSVGNSDVADGQRIAPKRT